MRESNITAQVPINQSLLRYFLNFFWCGSISSKLYLPLLCQLVGWWHFQILPPAAQQSDFLCLVSHFKRTNGCGSLSLFHWSLSWERCCDVSHLGEVGLSTLRCGGVSRFRGTLQQAWSTPLKNLLFVKPNGICVTLGMCNAWHIVYTYIAYV